MEKPDLTVAVAIYNVEKYLEECLESIIGQLDDGMELLLVDDGSTDSCGAICDRYANRDSRITVVHQENGGLSAARNTALERAAGEWIVFVDGDDRLPKNALADMRRYCHDAAQLVIFDYADFDEHGMYRRCPRHDSFVMDTPEALRQYRADILSPAQAAMTGKIVYGQCMTSWGKLWRMSHIRQYGLRFDTRIRKSEDSAFAFAASRGMNRILAADRCVYEYRRNRSSIMRRFAPQAPEQYRVLTSAVGQDMAVHGETEDPLLMQSFFDFCADGLRSALRQTLFHADCRWKRKERLAQLRELGQADWVRAAAEHNTTSPLLRWMKAGKYGRIDLYCRLSRWLRLARNGFLE